jgi:hypothetical protein
VMMARSRTRPSGLAKKALIEVRGCTAGEKRLGFPI